MFSYNIFIVLTIFSNGIANPIVNEPSRCCFAKKYSHKTQAISYIPQQNGTISKTYETEYNTAYDGENGLSAIRTGLKDTSNNDETIFWDIRDLRNKMTYSIYIQENLCEKMVDISNKNDNCISEDAIYTNSTMYNYNGKKTLVDTWIRNTKGYVNYQKIARDGCILLESGYTKLSNGMRSVQINTNYIEDILDRSIFAIPSDCEEITLKRK